MEVSQARCTEIFMRTAVWVDANVRSEMWHRGCVCVFCARMDLHRSSKCVSVSVWAIHMYENNFSVCENMWLNAAHHHSCVCVHLLLFFLFLAKRSRSHLATSHLHVILIHQWGGTSLLHCVFLLTKVVVNLVVLVFGFPGYIPPEHALRS